MTNTSDRLAAMEAALTQIDKKFGKGSAFRLGDDTRPPVQAISTGSLRIDHALGIGGIARGRITEVYGPESSGKTTLALKCIANAQKAGGLAAFIDAEHALDAEYARALGVDTDALIVSQPDTGEQALEIAEMLVRSGALSILTIDSVAALVPKAEIEGEMGDAHVGLQARLMSQALRKITGALYQANTAAVFINQLREKIGGMGYGPNETTTGGKALKFYASQRIDIRRIGAIKAGAAAEAPVIGNQTKVKVVKNKVAPPFKVAITEIMYGEGFSREGEIIDLGVECGLIKKSGAWFAVAGGDQLGQGKENSRQFLKDNPGLADDLQAQIVAKLGMGPKVAVEAEEALPSDDEIAREIAAEVRAGR